MDKKVTEEKDPLKQVTLGGAISAVIGVIAVPLTIAAGLTISLLAKKGKARK